MIVSVFVPPSRIDMSNLAAFAEAVGERVARDGCMVIDCSGVAWIASAGMRVLEMASHDAHITLVNPSPAVHLMAATFAGDVQCRDDRLMSRSVEPEVPRRGLVSVHIDGKVAS
jgi:anti-anti-sigma regulatory factor